MSDKDEYAIYLNEVIYTIKDKHIPHKITRGFPKGKIRALVGPSGAVEIPKRFIRYR